MKMIGISSGISVLKSWQGIVEICLRVACTVLCIIVLICAAVALATIRGNHDIANDKDADLYASGPGWLIFVAVMCMIIEPAITVVRFLNISIVNQYFLIFTFSDIFLSGIFAVGLFAGGVANAVYASRFANDYDDLKPYCKRHYVHKDTCDDLKTIRDAEGAAAAFSFFAMVTFGTLAGIMIVTWFLMRQRSSEEDI